MESFQRANLLLFFEMNKYILEFNKKIMFFLFFW